ncbi:hypothetical protein ElyMa_005668700 [Elysia marginata]|uniref:Uncharacterized protein n=1 Tax=Elysia marginata TaxID=1093978 RepID=A0AAV4FC98_9GAST|nr:hypothetical protein ElyMa_005668700 [Elysia marginata]
MEQRPVVSLAKVVRFVLVCLQPLWPVLNKNKLSGPAYPFKRFPLVRFGSSCSSKRLLFNLLIQVYIFEVGKPSESIMSSNKRNRQKPSSITSRSSSGFDLFVATKMQNTRWRYNRATRDSQNNFFGGVSDSTIIEDFECESGVSSK